jgi:serine/threonine-protein kinase HipA
LPVANSELVFFGDRAALLSERYDRGFAPDGVRFRHQEDFCQAMGLPPGAKSESNGGVGFPVRCDLLKRLKLDDYARDKLHFLRLAPFNLLIGNIHGNAKNFSVLYWFDGEGVFRTALAPFYDLASLTVYDNSPKTMSMDYGETRVRTAFTERGANKFIEDFAITPNRLKYAPLGTLESFEAVCPELLVERRKEHDKLADFYDGLDRQLTMGF